MAISQLRTEWVTIQAAAEHRQISTKTIRRWISTGLIRAERVGPRLIRVDLASLEALSEPLQYTDARSRI